MMPEYEIEMEMHTEHDKNGTTVTEIHEASDAYDVIIKVMEQYEHKTNNVKIAEVNQL